MRDLFDFDGNGDVSLEEETFGIMLVSGMLDPEAKEETGLFADEPDDSFDDDDGERDLW